VAALQGVQGISETMQAFVSNVRTYVRDHPQLNRLIAGEESSARLIAWAVLDALSNFNATPYFTSFTLEELLSRNFHHLLTRMTVVSLLESVGQLQTRNHINYSNGGINLGVNDKTPLILNWLQYYNATVEQKLVHAKVALNIEQCLGVGASGVHSELFAINASYLAF
jgi:hypothetical protein